MSSNPWFWWQASDIFSFDIFDSLIDIIDFNANMMNTTIGIFVQKTFDWGFFSQWVQKFDFGIVQIDENYSDTMLWQIFRFTEKGVKNGLKMGQIGQNILAIT